MYQSVGPSRPAPAPPPTGTGNPNPHRYTPTTNWDDSPFDTPSSELPRKVPPPRPPPPRVQPSPVEATTKGKGLPFKKATPQSVNILSNLFGSRSVNSKAATGSGPKLPPPPATLKKHHQYQSTRVSTVPLQSASMSSLSNQVRNSAVNSNNATSELIDWSSPPSSPTLTHKTHNSDCISVDSFGSETNSNSSPQNGSYSQAESGFEDDFAVQRPASTGSFQDFRRVSNQITMLDPFSAPPVRSDHGGGVSAAKIRNVPPPPIAQKPKIVEQSAFYTQNSISFQAAKPFDDPLNNGKSLIAPPAMVSMPTIIKPVISAKPMGIPQKGFKQGLAKRDSTDEEKTPSPPMPNCAPPPPPPEYFRLGGGILGGVPEEEGEEQQESYGVALYDYESEHEGDLNFRANDKIYLVRQENEEWMFGRCKRGCEGLFPVNYVEIKVPLRTTKSVTNSGRNVAASSAPVKINVPVVEIRKEERRCRALYDFNAEAAEDLSITEGDIITVVEQINEEWLFGRKKNGTQGQFPAAFVEYL